MVVHELVEMVQGDALMTAKLVCSEVVQVWMDSLVLLILLFETRLCFCNAMRNRLVFSMLMRRPPVDVHRKTVVLLMHVHAHVEMSFGWIHVALVSIWQPVYAQSI